MKFGEFLILENDRIAFLNSMRGDPATAALVFADWLEEHGNNDLAEALRIVFQGRAGSWQERDTLVKLLNREASRLGSLGYGFYGNSVEVSGRAEPEINKFLGGDVGLMSLNFDGHNIYGQKYVADAKPTKIDPELITQDDTIEALVITYVISLVKNVIGPMNRNYQSKSYGNVDFDTNKRVAAATVDSVLERMTGYLQQRDVAGLEQEISTLEKLPKVTDEDYNVGGVTIGAFDELADNPELRDRLLKTLVDHSGKKQLSNLIAYANAATMDEVCPMISQVAQKLGITELAEVFAANPIQNAILHVDIYETESEYPEEGEDYESGEPQHDVDEDCDLGDTLRHMQEMDTKESDMIYSRYENYRTGSKTERSMSVSYNEKRLRGDSLEVLWQASQQR